MNWLKDVIVDICVTIFIAAAFWFGDPWMWWVIAIYTGLLLIAKSIVLTSDKFFSRSPKSQPVPEWFLHLLYAANVVLLALAGWWYLMAAWCLIWLFSFLGLRKMN